MRKMREDIEDLELDGDPREAEGEESPEVTDRKQQIILQALGQSLLPLRAEAIQYRASSGIERRWREDERAFDGLDGSNPQEMIDYATGEAMRSAAGTPPPSRSTVVVNIIRGRCETAEGRFCEIEIPVDEKNWGLTVTPIPQLQDQLLDDRQAQQNGQPIKDNRGNAATMADVARDIKNKAKKAMVGMEAEIDDQLTECDFNGEQRKLVRNAVRMGTGVMKGPNVVKGVSRSWQEVRDGDKVAHILKSLENRSPESESVDPWNVYPSAGTTENVQKSCEHVWEVDEILPRDVRKLIGVPGYNQHQLMMVLKEEPKRTREATDGRRDSGDVARADRIRLGQSYEKWEYHGDISKQVLEDLGVDCDHAATAAVSGCVVFINDRPVKAVLNTLDTEQLIYDFFQWTVVNSDTPWGIGIPRMMVWLQRIITAAWRRMMDNAGASSSRVIILGKGVQPADGILEIGGGDKFFISTGDIEDAKKALHQFQLNSNQVELQNIIELALRFVDLETSMPTIFQGEVKKDPETLGATEIMVDSNNIGVRQRVKLYEDRITKPHLTRYYDFNMMYNEKSEIKGDFKVDPRGTSVLLERDQHAQTLMQVFGLRGVPEIDRITDWEKAAKQLFVSRKLDIIKSEAEIAEYDRDKKERPDAPPNPTVQAAQIRGKNDLEKEKMRHEGDMLELQHQSTEAEKDRAHKERMKEMDYNMRMMEYAEKRNIELDKLKVQLSMGSAGMNLQRELSTEGETKAKSVPEVTPPPTEPAQKAPVGQSFQQ